LEVSVVGQAKQSFNTYMNEEETLATGRVADSGIDLKFSGHPPIQGRRRKSTLTIGGQYLIFI
jgi:hypothetical protein